MPSIILPRRWQTQPQDATELDLSRSFIRGNVIAALPHGNGLILQDGRIYTGASATRNSCGSYAGVKDSLSSINVPLHQTEQFVDHSVLVVGARVHPTKTNTTYFRTKADGWFPSGLRSGATAGTVQATSGGSPNISTADLTIGVGDRYNAVLWRGNGLLGLQVGQRQATVSTVGQSTGGVARFDCPDWDTSDAYALLVYFPYVLSDAERSTLIENPWQLFRPQKRVLYFDVANGGGVTGTISATWENFTSSITGTTTVVGAISQTLSNFTSSIDGYPVTTGTIAQTLENYTSTISGSPIDSGTISQTLEDYTSNISGSIGSAVSGTIAVTLENFTQSAQGTTTVIGNMAVNLNDFTSAITGTTTVIGTSNISLDPFIMTANGYPGDVVLSRIRTLVGAGE